MTRSFAPMILLLTAGWLTAGRLAAQGGAPAEAFDPFDKQKDWVVQFDGAAGVARLEEWAFQGTVLVKDGVITLGGPAHTGAIQFKGPLGRPFKLLIEYRAEGPGAMLILETHGLLSRGSSGMSLPGARGEWHELLLVGTPNDRGGAAIVQYHRSLADKKAQRTGDFSAEAHTQLKVDAASGTPVSIRRILFEGAPAAERSQGLYFALAAVAGFLLLVAILGWWRRRREATPPAA